MLPTLAREGTHAENAVLSKELDQIVGKGALGVALSIGLDIAQITYVALRVLRGTMSLGVGVNYEEIESVKP